MPAYGCLAHGLNLLLGDILKIQDFKTVIDETKLVIKEVRSSHILKAILTEKQGKESISLKLPVVTRWLSTENSLISLISNQQFLKELAIDTRSKGFLDEKVKSLILKDSFWRRVIGVREILYPIYVAIKFVESDKPTITKSFEVFYNLRTNVISINDENPMKKFKFEIIEMINTRREYCLRPLHFCAYMLDPNLKGRYLSDNEKLEIVEFISQIGMAYFRDEKFVSNLLSEYGDYLTKSSFFSNEALWKHKFENPSIWWATMCPGKNLQVFANKILNLPTSSASCERSFSTQKDIHSVKRNRLTNERAGKLVFVKYNLKVSFLILIIK